MIERVGITSIFVTHDQEEAIEVADEIMIISKGRLEQKGSPWDIYKSPETPFVASFIGESTIVDNIAQLKGFEDAASRPGTKALIRPEYIEIGKPGEIKLASATLPGKVKHLHFRGSEWMVELLVGDTKLITYRSLEKEVLHPGDQVSVLVHRAYLFNDNESWIAENKLKVDPMPIHI
jgi:sulfate transport system ATP-binding protein